MTCGLDGCNRPHAAKPPIAQGQFRLPLCEPHLRTVQDMQEGGGGQRMCSYCGDKPPELVVEGSTDEWRGACNDCLIRLLDRGLGNVLGLDHDIPR